LVGAARLDLWSNVLGRAGVVGHGGLAFSMSFQTHSDKSPNGSAGT
jgi:hypothetical protein